MERLEVVESLTRGGVDDRASGDGGDRERSAAAGVAVELGQHDTGEVDALLKCLRGVDRVLTDHRVDDEQDLVRIRRRADVGGLLHHLRVHAQASGGVDDHDVVLLAARDLDTVAGDSDRVADPVARLRGVDRRSRLAGDDLQLVDGVRALKVGGDQQRSVALLLEQLRELAGECRLS